MKTEEPAPSSKDLRELARRIQEEADPNKMIELVQQLIAAFDQQQSRQKARLRGEHIPGGAPHGKAAEPVDSGGAQRA
jgi:hypothetical protein